MSLHQYFQSKASSSAVAQPRSTTDGSTVPEIPTQADPSEPPKSPSLATEHEDDEVRQTSKRMNFDDSAVESKVRRLEAGVPISLTRSQTERQNQDEKGNVMKSHPLSNSATLNRTNFGAPARRSTANALRTVLCEKRFAYGSKNHSVLLQVAQGNLVSEEVDAIVNAANERLAHGGGVARAIANAGKYVNADSRNWIVQYGSVPTGKTAWTRAGGDLCCKFVIHGVGPVWNLTNNTETDLDALLDSVVTESLIRGEELKCESISFPAVSSGIFGFPVDRCSRIMISAALRHFIQKDSKSSITKVCFTNIDSPTATTFEGTFRKLFPTQGTP